MLCSILAKTYLVDLILPILYCLCLCQQTLFQNSWHYLFDQIHSIWDSVCFLFGKKKRGGGELFTGFNCGVVAALVWPSMTSCPFHLWGLVLSAKCFSQVTVHQRDELKLDKVFVLPLSFTALLSRLKLSASLLPCMVRFAVLYQGRCFPNTSVRAFGKIGSNGVALPLKQCLVQQCPALCALVSWPSGCQATLSAGSALMLSAGSASLLVEVGPCPGLCAVREWWVTEQMTSGTKLRYSKLFWSGLFSLKVDWAILKWKRGRNFHT